MDPSHSEDIFRYHEETKHHYEQYARSPGHMDWQNQPNPFRFYQDTPVIELPLLEDYPVAGYPGLYQRKNNQEQPPALETIAGFLELSIGLSAWKAVAGSRWSLRMNPSSGNLHPTEAHLILPQLPGVPGGLYHYNALNHALEGRARVSDDVWRPLSQHFGCAGFMIALSTIFWRESWKYGERAFRYCNHDVGHALAALSISANLFGWKVTYLNGLSDKDLKRMLGFDRTRYADLEAEEPDLLCLVHSHDQLPMQRSLPQSVIDSFSELDIVGIPNKLSKQPVNWEIIYQTAARTRKPATLEQNYDYGDQARIEAPIPKYSAATLIRQRRSATDFDPAGSLSRHDLLAILDQTRPRNGCAPFDTQLTEVSTHLLIFVHRVNGLAAGLYFFCRNNSDLDPLKKLTHSKFLWQPVEDGFPLYLLAEGDYRQQAMMVSCHQDIAGSSAFSLGMIARFESSISAEPFRYKHLFWETGMIGQVLYLEAEAHAARGTGIGCYFDDAVHEILGLADRRYQSLYHFTIGRPIDDARLTTYPAYHHLSR